MQSCCVPPATQSCKRAGKAKDRPIAWSRSSASDLMGLPPRSMAGEKPQIQGLKRWLAVAVGSTRYLSGFQHHGCLLWLRLYVKKALDTAKVPVSWALLPLLTDHILPEALEFTYKVKRWQADARGCCPVLQSRINVDWLTFDPQMFAPLFPRLKEGILRDVFIQKAVVAWDHAPSNRIMVSLLLPGPREADQWLHDVRTSRNMWPLQKTSHVMANHLATETFMRRERRRLQARHI